MAVFRNASAETLIVGYGLPTGRAVEPDATIEVPDDAAGAYALNTNFVPVDDAAHAAYDRAHAPLVDDQADDAAAPVAPVVNETISTDVVVVVVDETMTDAERAFGEDEGARSE